MFEYIYNNLSVCPTLACGEEETMDYGIHYDIINSSMTNKNIQYCRYDEAEEELHIFWDVELSQADKDILDQIVLDNLPSGF